MGIIIEYAASLIDSILCIWFISGFINAKKNKLMALISTAIYFVITILCDKFLPNFNMLGTSILFVVSLIYAIIICQRHYVKAILACAIYKGVLILSSSLLFTIISSMIEDFGALLQGSDSTVRLVLISIHKIVIISVFVLILVVFKNANITDLLTGAAVFGVSVLTILGLGATMVAVTSGLYKSNPVSCYLLLITYILINIFVYLLVNRVKNLEKQKYELKLLGDRHEYQQEKYLEAAAVWNNIRKVQHDMKNHLVAIKGELDSGKIEECKEYVDTLIPKTDQIGKLMKSDNDILDYLINSKLCALKDTQVIVSGAVGDLSDISDGDLVSIFGNILDNAVEAIEGLEEKRIELLFNRHKDNRIIICKNTIGKSVLKDNSDLKTTKANHDAHGLGHIIVEETVTKLGGMIEYSEKGDMFVVQIILPDPT
ncbi:MAG: sensor histidine kinase [Clostridia bacterium]|nr:sensor histidine kinase [Clostridia bacterium]